MTNPPEDLLRRLVAVVGFAHMLRATLQTPELTDYQRGLAVDTLWAESLVPALERIRPNHIRLIRGLCDVTVTVGGLQGALLGGEGAPTVDDALARLGQVLDDLELLEPGLHIDLAGRIASHLENVRTIIPPEPPPDL